MAETQESPPKILDPLEAVLRRAIRAPVRDPERLLDELDELDDLNSVLEPKDRNKALDRESIQPAKSFPLSTTAFPAAERLPLLTIPLKPKPTRPIAPETILS